MPEPQFKSLPPEHQLLLRMAKETNGLDVIPLQELSGGQTGAFLYLASVSEAGNSRVEHFIVKFDHLNKRGGPGETERHRLAVSQAPPDFSRQHMPVLAYEFEHEGATALFYTLAGQSLQHFRTLASQENQSRLEALFAASNDFLLRGWNGAAGFLRAIEPQSILQKWLGYRLKTDGQIGALLRDPFGIDPQCEGLLIGGQAFPNPLHFGVERIAWQDSRPIDVLTGFQHGDLNIGNILAQFGDTSESLDGYFLIDFALYKAEMPLFYDQRYLEMSYLIRELAHVPLQKWVSFVVQYTDADMPDPRLIPVELAGACAIINAGRRAFESWIREVHPSLSDDLWGQSRLAAVAAGLNFANKTAIPTDARLAGLVYGAAHLKRYCERFGISLPTEARFLYDGRAKHETAASGRATPVRAMPKGNLPIQPTPFIGRQEAVDAIEALMTRTDGGLRLLTLTGPGGTGKTRLALQVAGELLGRFTDGTFFVDLAPIRDAQAVLAAIARVVGSTETSDLPLLKTLQTYLGGRAVLLLLDNFEQVTSAAPELMELLEGCPGLRALVTSREALHLRGEHVYAVPPLALPGGDLRTQSAEQLSQYEAVRFFIDRVQAVKPGFEVTNENAPAVAEICFRLDGLPLAIELAAARIKLFSPEALLERLGSRLQLLRGGARDLPQRQQALRDTIGWSYELLDQAEQRLFGLLSVFSGCTVDDVEAVAGRMTAEELEGDVIEGLASLVDKSLIRQVDRVGREPRLLMLETIREYAAERLAEDGAFSVAARRAHAARFAAYSAGQWERMKGREADDAVTEVEAELENVLAAWHYWVEEKDLEQLGNIVDALWKLYDVRGWYYATVDLTNDLLGVLAIVPHTPERAAQEIMLQISLARALLATQGYTDEAERAYVHAFDLCQSAGEIPQLFPVLRGLASFYVLRANHEKALEMGERILQLAERQGDPDMEVEGLLLKGYNLAFRDHPGQGLEYLERAITLDNPERRRARRLSLGSNPSVISRTVSALFLWMIGYPERARSRAAESVALARAIDHPYSVTYALFHSGLLNFWLRNFQTTEQSARELLRIAEEHGFHIWSAVGSCLLGASLIGL
jgi:predicted ATPase